MHTCMYIHVLHIYTCIHTFANINNMYHIYVLYIYIYNTCIYITHEFANINNYITAIELITNSAAFTLYCCLHIIYIYIYIDVHTSCCIHIIYIYIYIHTHTHTSTYINMRMSILTYTYTCKSTHISLCAQAYTCTHTSLTKKVIQLT
jgi:hypothetical protein